MLQLGNKLSRFFIHLIELFFQKGKGLLLLFFFNPILFIVSYLLFEISYQILFS